MPTQNYKERINKMNEVQLAATLIALIEKIKAKENKCNNLLRILDDRDECCKHYIDGKLSAYDYITFLIETMI